MAGNGKELESWFGESIGLNLARPTSEGQVVRILQDHARFPSPVRPVGSRHSMTRCISSQKPGEPTAWGTIVDMTGVVTWHDGTHGPGELDVVPNPGGATGTVTIPAGRRVFGVARELDKKEWMFRVNTELGSLTIGAAACGATKDSSHPGETAQVCHDVIGMRLVKPDGTIRTYDEINHPQEMKALRCSYGLFGIVTEVTFRVYKREYISLRHEKVKPANGKAFTPDELRAHFKRWLGPPKNGNAVFLYLFPYHNWIVAEMRKKPAAAGELEKYSLALRIRNYFWEKGSHCIERNARRLPAFLGHWVQDAFGAVLRWFLVHWLHVEKVSPVEQLVEFDIGDTEHRFTFSMWAFPEDEFAEILPWYFDFCAQHEATFRTGLPHASYHIEKDTSSLLSYSRHGTVWTLDPISPHGMPGWKPFLQEFNDYCSSKGGQPLLNQTPYLERQHVAHAFAGALPAFLATRQQFDPERRMLNAYFKDLFGL